MNWMQTNSEAEKKEKEKQTQRNKDEFTNLEMMKKAEENRLKMEYEEKMNASDRKKKREEAKSKAGKRRNDALAMSKLICFAFLVVATFSAMASGKRDKEPAQMEEKDLRIQVRILWYF